MVPIGSPDNGQTMLSHGTHVSRERRPQRIEKDKEHEKALVRSKNQKINPQRSKNNHDDDDNAREREKKKVHQQTTEKQQRKSSCVFSRRSF